MMRKIERKAWADDQGEEWELTTEETLEILRDAEFRVAAGKRGTQIEIMVNGRWLGFGRTDWQDDVRTGKYGETIAEAQLRASRYVERLPNYGEIPGARMNDKHFCVIDAMSDG